MQRQYITKNSNNNSSTNTQKSTLARTGITQIGTNTPITQQEIENQQYQQDQFEATKLQIQAKYGTITPEGQERLAFLQAKKAEFWQRYLAPIRRSKDFANIPITREQAEAKSKKAIQAKLTIGEPGDKYEQEADRVAAQVVRKINSPVAQQSNENLQREEMSEEDELMKKPEISGIQREAMPQEDEELQMKQAGDNGTSATAELESSIQQARGGGQPLADKIRKPMEHAFGFDFSRVKVHADAQADQLNQSIQAKAFTTGQDVFFRQGEYQPESRGGQELIAHELTHVVQQSGGAVQRSPQPQEKLKHQQATEPTSASGGDRAIQKKGEITEYRYGATEKTQGQGPTEETRIPSRVSPELIQRQVVINGMNNLGQITTVTVNRNNMMSLFNKTQGDHMTAFAVFGAMFRNRLQNQTLNQATGVLNNIFQEITQLPGVQNLANAPVFAQQIYNAQFLTVQNHQQIVQAAGLGVNLQQINQYASELLSLRNVVPLSAAEFGGTGHGEKAALNTMNQLEQGLANGNQLNLNNLTQAVVALLDTNRFESANQHPLNAYDQEILPGLVINGQNPIQINRQRMAEQHVQTIESAYPHIQQALMANGGIARQNLINSIVTELQNAG